MAVGVLDVKMVFKLGARTLTLDFRKIPFMAWGELKQATGFTQRTLIKALDDMDLDAVVAVIWLERKQRERKLRYVEVYQELQSAESDEDFEMLDMILKGRSLSGEPADDEDQGEDGDPTAGS